MLGDHIRGTIETTKKHKDIFIDSISKYKDNVNNANVLYIFILKFHTYNDVRISGCGKAEEGMIFIVTDSGRT
jgi:hypothetical protein